MAHLLERSRFRLRGERGQGLTEYIVVVALIGILLVGVVWNYKEQVRITIEGGKTQAMQWSSDMDTSPDDPLDPDPTDGALDDDPKSPADGN